MNDNKLEKINILIKDNKVNEAQSEISRLGPEYYKNAEYLYLRSKIFYLSKLYYMAIDTLLISLEFEQKDEVYKLLAEIYGLLGNKELNKKLLNSKTRLIAVNSLKDELSGIYRKKHWSKLHYVFLF